MEVTIEEQFYEYCKGINRDDGNDNDDNEGAMKELQRMLIQNPNFNVNWTHLTRRNNTPLHIACAQGNVALVRLLLGCAHLNPNLQTTAGDTPFLLACNQGHLDIVQLLIKDARVDINLSDHSNLSALWIAVDYGFLDIIECLLASDKLTHFNQKAAESSPYWPNTTPMELAKLKGKTEELSLLIQYKENPQKVRFEMKLKHGFLNNELNMTQYFVFSVLLTDGYYRVKNMGNPGIAGEGQEMIDSKKGIRFLGIMSQLPMEIQMGICNRIIYSAGNFIPSQYIDHIMQSFISSGWL